MGQRAFEKFKPYFVRTAQFKDKVTCCCRQHVEMRSLFKSCMQFRKRLLSREGSSEVKLYESLSELVDDTLCTRSANTHQHKISCLDRLCSECGVFKFSMLPGELDKSDVQISWERYEYTNVKVKGDKMIRKLVLVRKSSSPTEMFQYLKKLLETFPAHQFRAYWQSKRMKSLVENLPIGHCVTVHDFSENYKCTEQNEIQSSYFQKLEVSLHVTILHRHSVLEYDGKDSTAEEPNIVTEQFFVISPDQKHDHHYTHCVQNLVSEYLKSINCEISVMHEFTDGCSSQYKSRHCMGDVSYSCSDFGYAKILRNYFETSHARGPQDAAGGFIKKQADLAVIRGTHVIQSSSDLFDYAQSNLSTTADSSKCSQRIFRYVDSVNRDRDRNFLPVKENRKIHQVRSFDDGEIFVRKLSCYSCQSCIVGNYSTCMNDAQLGTYNKIKMVKESEHNDSDADSDNDEGVGDETNICDFVSKGTIFAVKADDTDCPYYILRASKDPIILRKTATDKWGASYYQGNKVIHGYYFNTIDNNSFKLKLLKRIPAIVPALSVIYICSEVDIDDNGLINLKLVSAWPNSAVLRPRIKCIYK
ncbi:unnamed protein product [Mytilus coruscus]|uniref:Uncharacterized protein n=1 Tax=Mytilus coruscus TaxID=42192 RepID=A0A6J8CA42_MYTCO|nr:unnamed protein product [Mytilus coruscus]